MAVSSFRGESLCHLPLYIAGIRRWCPLMKGEGVVEDRRRRERENMAGLREALHLQNNRDNDKLDIQVSSKYVMVI